MTKVTKDGLLTALLNAKLEPQTVQVDGVDVPIYIRKLTVKELAEVNKINDNPKADKQLFPVHLFIRTVCDKQGNALYTDDDLDALLNIDAILMNQVVKHIMALNFPDVDEAEKN